MAYDTVYCILSFRKLCLCVLSFDRFSVWMCDLYLYRRCQNDPLSWGSHGRGVCGLRCGHRWRSIPNSFCGMKLGTSIIYMFKWGNVKKYMCLLLKLNLFVFLSIFHELIGFCLEQLSASRYTCWEWPNPGAKAGNPRKPRDNTEGKAHQKRNEEIEETEKTGVLQRLQKHQLGRRLEYFKPPWFHPIFSHLGV